jgi:Glycosyltransferase family 9 (heptosyltransferase)
LENTSAEQLGAESLANDLLEHCLASRPWPEQLLDDLIAKGGDRELFRIVVERLGDLFEPALCRVYAELFSEVIARRTGLHAEHLAARYERIRKPRAFDRDPLSIENVFVLSRVTLGADIAVTSAILDAAKHRFPNAAIWFTGPDKSWKLFAADPRLRHLPIAYGRGGSIADRLSIWPQLREAVCLPRSVVIDPDSRLTQLGLLPICPEEDYYLFESRSYGDASDQPLPALARRWASEIFGIADARPYIATGLDAAEFATTVSFGVGENPSKRVADPFEEEILRRLPRPILIDKGAGGEEAERVERAVAKAGGNGIVMWDGSFAGFAAHIQRSRLFVGYDSAGGHVAAACSVPMISIFAGAVSERMFQRWRPTGAGKIEIIRPKGLSAAELLATFEDRLRKVSLSSGPQGAHPASRI